MAHIWPTYRWLPTTTADNTNSGIILRSVDFSRHQLSRAALRYRFRFPLALRKFVRLYKGFRDSRFAFSPCPPCV